MPTISVYLQAPVQSADHILYGAVASIGSGTQITTNVTGSGSGQSGPFNGAVGKTVRRYTTAQWNTFPRADALVADTGTIATIQGTPYQWFTANNITASRWQVGDVWAIDFQNPNSFFKWSENMKPSNTGTPDTSTEKYPRFEKTKVPEPFSANGQQDTDPLTTKWELKCDTLGRSYTNSAIPLPIPSLMMGDQYYNKMIDIGMRNEQITMSGTLVDRGVPTASNPRLQTIFDLVRTQHQATGTTTGDVSQGGEGQTPNNPRAYMRLTIGSGYEPSDYLESTGLSSAEAYGSEFTPVYAVNTNIIVRDRNYSPPDGIAGTTNETGNTLLGSERTVKSFRGMITQFNANLAGGRPDIWTWNMTFNVVKNEHDWTHTSD